MNTALSKATARVPRGHTGEEVRSCLGRIGAFPGFSSIECYQWLAGRFLKSQRLRFLRSCEIIKTAEKREFSTGGGLIRIPTTRSDGPSNDFVSPHAIVFSNSGISSHDLTVAALLIPVLLQSRDRKKVRKNVARRRNRLRHQRQVVCLHWWGAGGAPPNPPPAP